VDKDKRKKNEDNWHLQMTSSCPYAHKHKSKKSSCWLWHRRTALGAETQMPGSCLQFRSRAFYFIFYYFCGV